MAASFDQNRSAYQPSHNAYAQSTGTTFSQNPDNTFSESTGNHFSQPARNNFSQSTGNTFPQSTGHTFSQAPSNTFSHHAGNTMSQPTGNTFSQPTGNNMSQSAGNTFSQSTGNTMSQPTSNTFSQPTGNNMSQSAGNTFSQPTSNTFSNPTGSIGNTGNTGNTFSYPTNNNFSQSTSHNHPQAPRPIDTSAGTGFRGPNTGGSGPPDDLSRRLDIALHSDQGVEKLQSRLRQSIYSARDFSNLLKERCSLEDRYAQGYKKLVRNASESVRRPEARQGSFLHSFDETLRINDRIADNTLLFANGLHTMSEELRDMAENADKGRKFWKHNTTDAERRVADADLALQKARDRYNAAAEQYDRIRGGERPSGKFGLKNKSPAQQEEALKEKADMLDQEYNSRREAAQAQRYEFESSTRPQIVQALRDLIDELDAHLAMQLAKLASMSEKHIVSSGVAISPIKSESSTSVPQPRGLRQLAQEIDNRKDFNDYVLDGRGNTMPFGARTPRQSEPGQAFSPIQPSYTDPSATSNTGIQSHINSGAPQLPQIGASGGFSSSFETPRPTAANRTSYIGDQPMNTIIASTTQPATETQQSSYAPETRPPFESNPSIPAFDRGLPSTNGALPVPSLHDRTSGPLGTNPTQTTARGQAPSTVVPGMYMGRGSPSGAQAPAGNTGQSMGRGQGLPSQASGPGIGRGQQPFVTDRPQGPAGPDTGHGRDQRTFTDDRMTGMPAPNTGYGRGQQTTTNDRTQGLPTPDLGYERGQQTTANDRAQGLPTPDLGYGRGQPLPMNERQQGLPAPDTGYGRSQQSLNDRTSGLPKPNTEYGRGPTSTGVAHQSGFGRAQNPSYSEQTSGPNRGPDIAMGRGQMPLNTNQPSGLGRGQHSPYNDRIQGPGTTGEVPLGRGQSPTGPNKLTALGGREQQSPYTERGQDLPSAGPMGRGQTPTGRGLPNQQLAPQGKPSLPPNKPVFGVHLDELFRRDGTAVPAIVFQCIQAVDIHGINTEGIYRVSGSSPTIAQLKAEFDHDSSIVDLKRPQLYNNDIASVATLLKNFLRDLPDPLLTAPAYQSFIQAAQYDDLVMRRDALHQYINSLPDPNYATLRVLVLHLHRISTNSEVNKMDIKNLSIVFGPTVMGGSIVSDAGWQTKVMETILHHTFEVFDPDE